MGSARWRRLPHDSPKSAPWLRPCVGRGPRRQREPPTPRPRGTTGPPRRAATPRATAPPTPRPTPTTEALRSSVVRARSAAEMAGRWGRESESVDNTRGKRAAVDNVPPRVPHVRQEPESYFPSCSAGGSAGNSREQPSNGTSRAVPGGTARDHPSSGGNGTGHRSSRVTSTSVGSFTPALDPASTAPSRYPQVAPRTRRDAASPPTITSDSS